MRILTIGNMYPPHHQGGYELAWWRWVGSARAAGHEVEILTTDHTEADPDPEIPEDPHVHRELRWYWRDHEFPRYGPSAALALERDVGSVLERHLRREPEAICVWAMGGLSLSILARLERAGRPVVFVVMDDWCVYGPKVDAWNRRMRRPGLRRLAERLGAPAPPRIPPIGRWLFLSGQTRSRALEEGGVDPERVEIAHRGPDPDEFAPVAARDWKGRLLCVGRIEPRKGQAIAIDALPELPDCSLRIVGTGEPAYIAELGTLAADLGVSDRVGFDRLPRSEIPSAYADADAVLFPVQWLEPWGFVALEAMAVGRPVIATGEGGSGEFLIDGRNCLLYRPKDDPVALARAVDELKDPELRGRLIADGHETAAQITEDGFNAQVTAALEAEAGG